jgi:hypothetical protein
MIKQEEKNFKQWNIEQTKAETKASEDFRTLQIISGDYNMSKYCNAESNLKQILDNKNIELDVKEYALRCYKSYIKCSTRYECLTELLGIFN